MRPLDLQSTLPVNYVRCLVGMFAMSLALGSSRPTAVAQMTLGGDVVVIPWSAKDRTFLCAGPVNTFRSPIVLVNGDCDILLDGKKVNIADLKSCMVGE